MMTLNNWIELKLFLILSSKRHYASEKYIYTKCKWQNRDLLKTFYGNTYKGKIQIAEFEGKCKYLIKLFIPPLLVPFSATC